MSRQSSRIQNPKRTIMGRFEIDSSAEQGTYYNTSLRDDGTGTSLSSNVMPQRYRSTENIRSLDEELERVEVTHHPRLDYEQRAKRRCYLTIFLTVCLVAVAIVFVANLSSGLASNLNNNKQRLENSFANGGSIDERPVDIDGTEVSVGEQEGTGMDVAFQTPSIDSWEEEEQQQSTTNKSEEGKDEIDEIDLSNYNCIGDRLGNRTPLKHGTFLCSHRNGYVVGILNGENMNDDDPAAGDFIWRHVPSGETHSFHRWMEGDTSTIDATSPFVDTLEEFVLSTEGAFQLYNPEGVLLWESLPNLKKKKLDVITYRDECLDDYTCPYLHLHSDGVIVINWVGDSGWNEKNIMKIYDFPEY